jgi:CubicO group peptidase (beta-lactamase class C family)
MIRLLRISCPTACVLLLSSCATYPAPALPSADSEVLGLSAPALARMDEALQTFVDSGQVGGVYAVIARHGRIGYERAFGWRDVARREPLRRDHVFRIYSMTKPVIAAAVLRLVDEGRVGLDDPVSAWIPSFAGVQVFAGGSANAPVLEAPASPITIRQLLNHTSGLAYGLTTGPVDTIFGAAALYNAARPLDEFTDLLAGIPLLFHPGSRWSYGSGLDVAGRIIEAVTGQSLDRYLDDAIFRPLGMRDTGFRIRPDMRHRVVSVYGRAPDGTLRQLGTDGLMAMFEPEARFLWGSGGLVSTPDDFLRFARMLQNGGTLDGVRILRPETVALMTGNTVAPELEPLPGGSLGGQGYSFGLSMAVKVDTVGATRPAPVGTFRWSGYIGTYFWVDPVHDLIAMVWTQFSPGARYPLELTFERLVYEALGLP